MEIRHIRYFIAVAEELHFGRAANRLNISQPPLSQQIIQLEKEMDVILLKRSKRHVELTEAGKLFLDRSYEIMNLLEKGIEDTRKVHIGEFGQLKVGFTGILNSILIRLYQYYRSKQSQNELILHHLSSNKQVESLQEKKIHIGFICPPIDTEIFNFRFIGDARFIAALPRNHPLANDSSPLDIKELKNEPFVLPPRNIEPGYYDTILSMCHKSGFTPKVSQEAEGIYNVLTFVAANMGVSLVTTMARERTIPDIVYRDLTGEIPKMELYLVWMKSDENEPIVKNFLNLVDEWVESENKR